MLRHCRARRFCTDVQSMKILSVNANKIFVVVATFVKNRKFTSFLIIFYFEVIHSLQVRQMLSP